MASSSIVDRLLFPAPPSSYSQSTFPRQLLFLPRIHPSPTFQSNDSATHKDHLNYSIPVLTINLRNPQFVVLFCHGNATDVGKVSGLLARLASSLSPTANVAFFAVEYTGYGVCQGSSSVPSNDVQFSEQVESVYWFVRHFLQVPSDRIILMGRSIGSFPALRLASICSRISSEENIAGVIVISGFLSIIDIIANIAGSASRVPASWMIQKQKQFNNIENVRHVNCPALFIHGAVDPLIPFSHSIELFDQCPSGVKMMHISPTMTHNEFSILTDWLTPIQSFLERINKIHHQSHGESLLWSPRVDPLNIVIPDFLFVPHDDVPQNQRILRQHQLSWFYWIFLLLL